LKSNARSNAIRAMCITVLGSGYGPIAPGTWGSFAAAVIFAAAWWIAGMLSAPTWVVDVVVALAGIAVSSWLSVVWGEWAIARFGRKDPKQFVLDEFAGQWVALLWLPPLAAAGFWPFAWIVGGQFVLFRILDVIKPPPARQLERLPAGWGILCDDLMSGLYAAAIGQCLWRLTPLATWLGLSSA
jgi:phosphatidylglycerophosphatase A